MSFSISLNKFRSNTPSFIFFIMETLLVSSLYELEASLNYFVSITHCKLMYFWPESVTSYFIIVNLCIYWLRKIVNELMNCVIFTRSCYISYSIIYSIVPITSVSTASISLFKWFKDFCIVFGFSNRPNLDKFIIITFRNPVKATCSMCIESKWAVNYIRTFNKLSFIKEYTLTFLRIARFVIIYIYLWCYFS
jgi:hypothetical protein